MVEGNISSEFRFKKIDGSRNYCFNSIKQVNTKYKINEIVNKFLLAGDRFMLEMHL